MVNDSLHSKDGPNDDGVPPKGSTPAEEIRVQLTQLRDRIGTRTRELAAAKKALTGLLAVGGLSDLRVTESQRERLSKADLTGTDMEDDCRSICASLTTYIVRKKKSQRLLVVGALHRAAEAEGIEIVKLADTPPTFLLAPMSVELNFDKSVVAVKYAREEVLQTSLEAAAIVAGRRKAMEVIREGALDPPEFFALLRRAYEMVCLVRGVSVGTRVDLVDLLVPLTVLRVQIDKWRTLKLSKQHAYSRAKLAYQLQRLRKAGLLEKGRSRLDLGAATGGSTKHKRNVLFIPTGAGEGQYYVSMRFVSGD